MANPINAQLTLRFTRFESMHAHCGLPVPSHLESSVAPAVRVRGEGLRRFYFDNDLSWEAEN